jgi:hydrogenase expression/formation protein HypC
MCLAIPGKIMTVTGDDPLFRTAKVDFDGVAREVSLSCLPQAKVGDYVIVHVGVAISLLDEEEAKPSPGSLWKSEGARPIPSPATGWKICFHPKSPWCTARVARSA